jgi:hypothetical protein
MKKLDALRFASLLATVALILCSTLPLYAQEKKKPRIVLQITVDQLGGDLPHRYYSEFGEVDSDTSTRAVSSIRIRGGYAESCSGAYQFLSRKTLCASRHTKAGSGVLFLWTNPVSLRPPE